IRRKTFAAIGLKGEDRLLSVFPCAEGEEILLVTRKGQAIRFDLAEVPSTGRVAAGVRGIRLDEGDEVILAAAFDNSAQLILVTDRGYAKRVIGSLVDHQARAGKGAKCITLAKDGLNGTKLAAAGVVRALSGMTIVQSSGHLTPMTTGDLPVSPMNDKGKPVVLALAVDPVVDLIL
ncbi:MAG: hypothetical protein IJ174_07925, partial [Clostridia bacterium]|nr:hypothetical protein [Clostridia bacterium]